MNLKAMMAMKDHAKNVCTTHRWRVAWMIGAESPPPRMRTARAKSLKRRTRQRFLENQEGSCDDVFLHRVTNEYHLERLDLLKETGMVPRRVWGSPRTGKVRR